MWWAPHEWIWNQDASNATSSIIPACICATNAIKQAAREESGRARAWLMQTQEKSSRPSWRLPPSRALRPPPAPEKKEGKHKVKERRRARIFVHSWVGTAEKYSSGDGTGQPPTHGHGVLPCGHCRPPRRRSRLAGRELRSTWASSTCPCPLPLPDDRPARVL